MKDFFLYARDSVFLFARHYKLQIVQINVIKIYKTIMISFVIVCAFNVNVIMIMIDNCL